jgi:hypothetical protein
MSRQEPNPFDVLGILPTISLTPADVRRAYTTALSHVRRGFDIPVGLQTHIRSVAAVEPRPPAAQFVATDFVAGNLCI